MTSPSGLTTIGNGAFCECSGLTSLTLPSDLTTIGERAFERCNGLTSLTLPSGLTTIGEWAFCGCSGLASLTLPSSLTTIGANAFWGCGGLKCIYAYMSKIPQMGSGAFYNCNTSDCILYVPKGTYQDYWLSDFGCFDNILEFDPTGIDVALRNNDAKELSRYSVDGQRLGVSTKGLNIVKYCNGTVKKIMVK